MGGSQAVLGSHCGSSHAQPFWSALSHSWGHPELAGGWLVCTHVSLSTDLNHTFYSKGAALHPGAVRKGWDVCVWIEKSFIFSAINISALLSRYGENIILRQKYSDQRRSIRRFLWNKCSQENKGTFFSPDFLPTLNPVHLFVRI